MFLKYKNIIFKIIRSKVTDYAALMEYHASRLQISSISSLNVVLEIIKDQ